jgi:hypothetical protein
MGYATRDELLAVLNELLEAERAGARVTLRMTKEVPNALKTTMVEVQRGALVRRSDEGDPAA